MPRRIPMEIPPVSIAGIADEVWAYVNRKLTNLDDARAAKIDNVDEKISSRAPSGEYNTEMARITAARAALIDRIVDSIQTGTANWLKAYGTAEQDLFEITASVRELLIMVKEMGAVEPSTQVLTFRLYRYEDSSWQFEDSINIIPTEKDVMTVSDVHGRTKVTLQPSVETQQNYTLPYVLYYQ